jgi:hypothetical protein
VAAPRTRVAARSSGVGAPRPPERDDLDVLLNPLLTFAQDMLRKNGEFHPFGNSMTIDGAVELSAAWTGSENPPAQELIDLIVAGLRRKAAARGIRAAGLCYDVRIRGSDGKATDAIAVALEHVAGDTVLVLMPYSKGRLSGVRFGELSSQPGERRIFVE